MSIPKGTKLNRREIKKRNWKILSAKKKNYSDAEIAESLGITRQRVWQILNKPSSYWKDGGDSWGRPKKKNSEWSNQINTYKIRKEDAKKN